MRITRRMVGTGRTTEEETSEWMRAPTGWDLTALAMRIQADKARRRQEKRTKRRRAAVREHRKEARAERWRRKYQTPSDSPFMRLPGMAGAAITHRRQPVVSADVRRKAGMASKGAASTLDHETSKRILSLMAEDWTITAIAKELGIPRTTLSRWLSSGRVAKVAAAVGERPTHKN